MTANTLKSVVRDAVTRVAARGHDTLDDAELIRQCLSSRDGSAFAAIVARHGRIVWSVCRQSLTREADAEDAFQATFIALFKSLSKIRNGASLPGWLHAAAVRVCLQMRKQTGRRLRREERSAKAETDRPVAETSWDGLLAAVHEEVADLPTKLRDPFVLVDLQGHSQSDAARMLKWKAGTFTGRLSEARAMLLARLTKRGLAPAAVLAGAGLSSMTAVATVPAVLLESTTTLIRTPSNIPAGLNLLATAVTEGPMMTKMKLLAAGVMLTTALGTTLVVGQGPTTTKLPDAATTRPAETPDVRYEPRTNVSTDPATGTTRYESYYEPVSVNRPQFEYKSFRFISPLDNAAAFERFDSELNKLGQEGWDLVNTVMVNNTTMLAVMKRQKVAFARSTVPLGIPTGQPDATATPIYRSPIGRSAGVERTLPSRNTETLPEVSRGESLPMSIPSPSVSKPVGESTAKHIVVMDLKYADSAEISVLINQLFRDEGVQVTATTGSLVIKAKQQDSLDTIKALVERLDSKAKEQPKKPTEPKRGSATTPSPSPSLTLPSSDQ